MGRSVARFVPSAGIGVWIAAACMLAAGGLVATWMTRSGPAKQPGPPPPGVVVTPLDLSRPPLTRELMSAGQLGGALYPTSGPLGDEDSSAASADLASSRLSFGEAIEAWNRHEWQRAASLVRAYLERFPESPWASEAALHLGCEARYQGRFGEAEQHYRWVIDHNQGVDHVGARMLRGKALQRLGVLATLEGDVPAARDSFTQLRNESADWRQRTYASHWLQRLSRYEADAVAMADCGSRALAQMLEREGRPEEAARVRALRPPSKRGYDLAQLADLAGEHGYALTGRRIAVTDLDRVPLPAILQIPRRSASAASHYWLLEEVDGDRVRILDPQSGRTFRQTRSELAREWSGAALVLSPRPPGEADLPGQAIAATDMTNLSGACCGAPRPEDELGDPGRHKKGPCGAPEWSVNPLNLNFYVTDAPLWYVPAYGPRVELRLHYNSQSAITYSEPFGNKWIFDYGTYLVEDPGGVVTVFMPDGRRYLYTPDGSGGYTRPFRAVDDLVKVAANHFELHSPDGTIRTYAIPSGTSSLQPFLVALQDAHGQSLTFGYDTNVRLTTITDATGAVTTLAYDTDGLVTSVADPFGRSALFEYDAGRNLTKITDMAGYWTSFGYDADVYLSSLDNPSGHWSFLTEPADGNPLNADNYAPPGQPMFESFRITATDPFGAQSEYYYYGGIGPWSPTGNYSWYASPKLYVPWRSAETNVFYGHPFALDTPKRRYLPSPAGPGGADIGEILTPEGTSTRYAYDGFGYPSLVGDGHGHDWTFTHNAIGRLTSITDPNGSTATLAYAANGYDLENVVDGRGTVAFGYNTTHDVVSATNRSGHAWAYAYNAYGRMTSATDPNDVVTTYTYDGTTQRLQTVTRQGEVLESFTYDPIGRVATQTDANGVTVTYTYNDLDDVTQLSFPDGRSIDFTYAACCAHLVETVTDRGNHIASFAYDEAQRLAKAVGPDGAITRYEYDPNGNLAAILDPHGNATRFEYDRDDRLVRKLYPDGGEETFAYDAAGLLAKRTGARGVVTSYGWNARDELASVAYSDGTPGVGFGRDAFGRVTARSDASGSWAFGWGPDDQLQSVDGPLASDTLTYAYDLLERPMGVSVDGSPFAGYGFDDFGRRTSTTWGASTFTHTYTGARFLPDNLQRPSGCTSTFGYDTVSRLASVLHESPSATVIESHVYTRGADDLPSSETAMTPIADPTLGPELVTYEHDAANAITSSTGPPLAWSYDADGNLVQGYTPDGYAFSASYDGENRLASLEYTDGNGALRRTEYTYGGDGFVARRVEKVDGVVAEDVRFVRDDGLVVQERDAANTVLREYLWGPDRGGGGIGSLVALRAGGQEYEYLYDGRGNVSSLVDASGSVVAAYATDPFGRLLARSGSLDQPYRFATKRYDEATGLVDFGLRFYSAPLGRWLTRDPIREEGGLNLYEYAGNDPVAFADAWGEKQGTVNLPPGGEYQLPGGEVIRCPRGCELRLNPPPRPWKRRAYNCVKYITGKIWVTLFGPGERYERATDNAVTGPRG